MKVLVIISEVAAFTFDRVNAQNFKVCKYEGVVWVESISSSKLAAISMFSFTAGKIELCSNGIRSGSSSFYDSLC